MGGARLETDEQRVQRENCPINKLVTRIIEEGAVNINAMLKKYHDVRKHLFESGVQAVLEGILEMGSDKLWESNRVLTFGLSLEGLADQTDALRKCEYLYSVFAWLDFDVFYDELRERVNYHLNQTAWQVSQIEKHDSGSGLDFTVYLGWRSGRK